MCYDTYSVLLGIIMWLTSDTIFNNDDHIIEL